MIKKTLIFFSLTAGIGFSSYVFAYNAGNVESGCKDPRFKSFTPSPKSEVNPESEIYFTVSGYADPTTIKAAAKNVPLTLNIVDKNSFYAVSATLPASLNGKYARIHVKANNTTECKAKDGWLIKIRDKAVGSEDVAVEINEETQ